jgi:hypothetical protein
VNAPGATRRALLARAGAGAVAALAAGIAGPATAAPAAGGDVAILNYLLTLEYLQAAFYSEAEREGALRGQAATAAARIGAVERAHVAALHSALGARAIARPAFDFQGATADGDAFLRTAVAFEDLGTAAYAGQLGAIGSARLRAAAVSIHTVEARHAAWIRYLAAQPPAPAAADRPISRSEAERVVRSAGFIVSAPTTTADRAPSFAG